jgi:rod shape-determining protein MreB
MIFKPIPFYVKLYYNAIEVSNLKSGVTVKRQAINGFSTKRLILADFNKAELLLSEIINELNPNKFGVSISLKTLIHIVEELEDGITELEKRGLRDLAEQVGSKEVYLWPDYKKLTDEQALQELTTLENAIL